MGGGEDGRQFDDALRRERDELRARLDSLMRDSAERVWCYEFKPPIPTGAPLAEQVARIFEGVLVECNEQGARDYGAERTEDVLGRTHAENTPTPRDQVARGFEHFITEGYRLADYVTHEPQPDGAERSFCTNCIGTVEDGLLLRIWGRTREITAERQTELALAHSRRELSRSEASYRALVENLDDIVYSIDAQGNFEYLSPVAQRRFGIDHEAMVGRPVFELVHPDDLPEVAASMARAMEGVLEPIEFRGLDAAGNAYPVRARSRARVRDGQLVGFDGVIVDLTELKRAEHAERERLRAHRVLLGNLPGAAYRCKLDRHWTIEIISEGCHALFGYATEDLVNNAKLSLNDLIAPEDRQRVWDEVQEAIAADRPYTLEYCVETASGERKWVWEKGLAVRGDDGEVVALEGLITDITARRRASRQAESYNRRLLALTTVLQQLAVARDVQSVCSTVTTAAREITGADGATLGLRDGQLCHYVEEVTELPTGPFFQGKRLPLAQTFAGSVIDSRQPLIIEDFAELPASRRLQAQPAGLKSVAIVPVRVEAPIGVIGCYWSRPQHIGDEELQFMQALADAAAVAIDNVRSVAMLAEASAHMRAIYDHLPTATLVWRQVGDDFVLEAFNGEAAELGASIGIRIGLRTSELLPLFPRLEGEMKRCASSGERSKHEVETTLPGESTPRQLVLSFGFVPEDMVAVHVEDVSAQRVVAEQLRVSQRLEAVARLAGGVAHDFNNMLSVIINYAELVAEQLDAADPIREDMAAIREAGERAARLTRQLLAFSRKQVLSLDVIDLNEVVTGIGTMLRRLLGEDIELDVSLASDLGHVEADAGQIEQVIMNLAVNARDAMPRGGALRIETRNVELEQPRAELEAGRYVLLSVGDDGVGISAETREHLFEPFFTTKDVDKGTGLGLATVYGIVKQSGGGIDIDSAPGEGARFDIFLPRVDRAVSTSRRAARPDALVGDETVLLVEDESVVRRIAQRILEAAGYHVLVAATGQEAIALCEQHGEAIDLLLTDVVMPRISGREVADRARALVPKIKVLFMSGYTDDAIVRHGVDAGRHFLLPKPFDPPTLTRKVREVLDAEFVRGGGGGYG